VRDFSIFAIEDLGELFPFGTAAFNLEEVEEVELDKNHT